MKHSGTEERAKMNEQFGASHSIRGGICGSSSTGTDAAQSTGARKLNTGLGGRPFCLKWWKILRRHLSTRKDGPQKIHPSIIIRNRLTQWERSKRRRFKPVQERISVRAENNARPCTNTNEGRYGDCDRIEKTARIRTCAMRLEQHIQHRIAGLDVPPLHSVKTSDDVLLGGVKQMQPTQVGAVGEGWTADNSSEAGDQHLVSHRVGANQSQMPSECRNGFGAIIQCFEHLPTQSLPQRCHFLRPRTFVASSRISRQFPRKPSGKSDCGYRRYSLKPSGRDVRPDGSVVIGPSDCPKEKPGNAGNNDGCRNVVISHEAHFRDGVEGHDQKTRERGVSGADIEQSTKTLRRPLTIGKRRAA